MALVYRSTVGRRLTVSEGDGNISALGQSSTTVFTQAGAGAVARTVQAKERDVFHVKDFGVVGDGVTDDTTALTNAITATGNGTLYISGTPLISSTITLSQGKIIFEGPIGFNSSTRPDSYLLKKSTLSGYCIQLGNSAHCVGGGVVAQEGNGGDNIRLVGHSSRWDNGYSENAGQYGWFVDGSSNCNGWRLDHCHAYGNTSHGFFFSGADANAGLAAGCESLSNGGDGFHSDNAAWNVFIGCTGESNTGWGFLAKNGEDNTLIGGDFEVNTAGDIKIESTEDFFIIVQKNSAFSITDEGFRTRRVDRYVNSRGTFHPALYGSGGTTKTATAVTISGTTATITSATHGYSNGDTVFHLDFSNGNLNGAFSISNVAADTYDITFRTDVSTTVPTTATGLTVTVQKCGVATTAIGRYVLYDGVCEFWAQIVTSAVTNITTNVEFVLPFAGENISASFHSSFDIGYMDGVTCTNNLNLILQQDADVRAKFYEDIGGTPGSPSQLQAAGLAAATTFILHGRYLIDRAN